MKFGLLVQQGATFLSGLSNPTLFLVLSFILSACLVWCKIPSSFREKACGLLYVFSGLSVLFFSTDPVRVAIGFDIMAIAAMLLIALGGSGSGYKAFIAYACAHFLSGVLLIVGACQFMHLGLMEGVPRILFITGLMINAAAFPLSSWVPYTYPNASRSGIIILSTFTTKIAIYVLLMMLTEGEFIIQYLGIATVLYGAIFAILAKEVRLVMSYGVVGNVGLLLIAVGCGRDVLPANLLITQMAVSVMYQTLLFMVVDSVACDARRLSRGELWVGTMCCIVALLNLCAFPGTASYIVKSALLHLDTDSLNYAIFRKVYPALGLLLFMSTGVKLYWGWIRCYVHEKDSVSGFRGVSTAALATILLLLGLPSVWRVIFPECSIAYSIGDLISRTIGVGACIACFVCFINKFTERWDFSRLETRVYKAFAHLFELICVYLGSTKKNFSSKDDSSEVINICTGYVSLNHGSGPVYTASSTILCSMLFILIMFMVWIYV